mmetsp:Transcript_22476/g.72977  ORF Transcript_22476/g.72977 Transcript_22476/m.72977 type:complete len:153 (-) Transcript_22476:132-590(-)
MRGEQVDGAVTVAVMPQKSESGSVSCSWGRGGEGSVVPCSPRKCGAVRRAADAAPHPPATPAKEGAVRRAAGAKRALALGASRSAGDAAAAAAASLRAYFAKQDAAAAARFERDWGFDIAKHRPVPRSQWVWESVESEPQPDEPPARRRRLC